VLYIQHYIHVSTPQENPAGSAFLHHTKMQGLPYPDYPPPISREQEAYILNTIKDWSIQHGLAVRPSSSFVPEKINDSGVLATTAPVTLFPSPFPESCFWEGRLLQTTFNELYAAVSNDEQWIEEIMEG
jgi:glutathione synthase